ncbi:MAG TPA: CHAT domain-containing protein, partial [Puia sp.]|nr:CHAT domain-containing protein [Puia sp.]
KKPEYLQKAVEVYITADRLLNNIKERQTELESKLYWPGYARRLYEHAVETSLLQNNPDEAFYFFEKSRAAVLYDQLSRQNKITNKDISDEADIKKRILQLKRKLAATEASSNQYIEIQTELLNNNEQLIRLDQIIKDRNPLYYQSFLDTSFIRLEDVRNKLLKDHKALLEIFEGDTAVYSLLITPEKTYFHKISKTDFDSTAKNYMDYLSNTVLLNRKFNNFCKTSGHLYQLLFRDYLLPAGRIIISPDGNYFPFESLITNRNYSSPEYFLSNYAVSYTYSARYLLNDFAGNSSDATGNFFGIAPVHYAPSFSLTTLKGSDQSLKEIGSYFHDPNILVAGQATKNNFLRQYAGYKIIQLYTHASDTSVNGEPVIHFADSALYLSDLISETKPQARLIVLSACETGNGQLYLGEGVFSFNRGFASLGIPSSIINLWSVDNQSTYRITELFYKYLSEGMPMDIALQKAKQEFFLHASKEQRLPYYWAAAIVAGKADVLHFEKKPSWKRIVYIGAVCIGLFILVFLILRWNKRLGR